MLANIKTIIQKLSRVAIICNTKYLNDDFLKCIHFNRTECSYRETKLGGGLFIYT